MELYLVLRSGLKYIRRFWRRIAGAHQGHLSVAE